MLSLLVVFAAALAAASPIKQRRSGPKNWNLFRTFEGESWYDGWDFVTFDDPTHGATNYVGLDEARNKGLAWTRGTQFGMTCDTRSIVGDDVRGRDSVRIHSKDWYGTVMAVADIAHMPAGCGSWPAWWTNGQGAWPSGGEFDIIEGTNGQGSNRVTLHTKSKQCSLPTGFHPGISEMSGKVATYSCYGGAGCSIEDPNPKSWAQGFNDNGGGWYVMRRNPSGYAVWFFNRDSTAIPDSVKYGLGTIDEDTLGTKVADFPFWGNLSSCGELSEHFTDQQFIFNIAMGGDWARDRYKAAGCPGEIYNQIKNNPEMLSEAYWLINSMRLYGASGNAEVSPDAIQPAPPFTIEGPPHVTATLAAQEAPMPTTSTPEQQQESPTPTQTPTQESPMPSPTPTPRPDAAGPEGGEAPEESPNPAIATKEGDSNGYGVPSPATAGQDNRDGEGNGAPPPAPAPAPATESEDEGGDNGDNGGEGNGDNSNSWDGNNNDGNWWDNNRKNKNRNKGEVRHHVGWRQWW